MISRLVTDGKELEMQDEGSAGDRGRDGDRWLSFPDK